MHMLIIFIIFPIEACAYVGRYVDLSCLFLAQNFKGLLVQRLRWLRHCCSIGLTPVCERACSYILAALKVIGFLIYSKSLIFCLWVAVAQPKPQ